MMNSVNVDLISLLLYKVFFERYFFRTMRADGYVVVFNEKIVLEDI